MADPRALLCALVFVLYGSVAVLILALLVPPFENPDEFNHYDRADLVATGAMIATRYGGPETSGGKIDLGIDTVDSIIGSVRFHPERKVTRPMLQAAGNIRWGRHVWLTFDNTSIYPPFFYIPDAIGIRVGERLRWSVVDTLELSRLLDGASCVMLGALAIAGAGAAAPMLFALLALPMSLTQFAAVGQDGLMFASAALAMAALVRLRRDRPDRWTRDLLLLCLSLDLVIMARPPYAPLACAPLLLDSLCWRRRIQACLATLAPAAAWSALMSAITIINAHVAAGVHPAAQLAHLLSEPARWPMLVRNTYAHEGLTGLPFIDEMIGLLGWTDTPLPGAYYDLARIILVLALVSSLSSHPVLAPSSRLMMAACLLLAWCLLFVFEYLTWNGLDAPFINGVQGRYFIPLALFLPALLPALRLPASVQASLQPIVLGFPALSIAVMVHTIVLRYFV